MKIVSIKLQIISVKLERDDYMCWMDKLDSSTVHGVVVGASGFW